MRGSKEGRKGCSRSEDLHSSSHSTPPPLYDHTTPRRRSGAAVVVGEAMDLSCGPLSLLSFPFVSQRVRQQSAQSCVPLQQQGRSEEGDKGAGRVMDRPSAFSSPPTLIELAVLSCGELIVGSRGQCLRCICAGTTVRLRAGRLRAVWGGVELRCSIFRHEDCLSFRLADCSAGLVRGT